MDKLGTCQIHPETAAFICRQIEKSLLPSMEESSDRRNRLYGSYGRVTSLWLSTKRLAEIPCAKLRKSSTLPTKSRGALLPRFTVNTYFRRPLLPQKSLKIILIFSFMTRIYDVRQCHFPGDQNRAEDRNGEEAYSRDEEGQHVFQSLSSG